WHDPEQGSDLRGLRRVRDRLVDHRSLSGGVDRGGRHGRLDGGGRLVCPEASGVVSERRRGGSTMRFVKARTAILAAAATVAARIAVRAFTNRIVLPPRR